MRISSLAGTAITLLLAGAAANADPETYSFTGIVNYSALSYVPVGATVTGTITIDLANADPAQSNPPSLTLGWTAQSDGPFVFSMTVETGEFYYSTGAPTPYQTESAVSGQPFTAWPQYEYSWAAGEYSLSNDGYFGGSSVNFYSTTTAPFTRAGLPVLAATTSTQGNATNDPNGFPSGIYWYFTSLVLQPTPPPRPTPPPCGLKCV